MRGGGGGGGRQSVSRCINKDEIFGNAIDSIVVHRTAYSSTLCHILCKVTFLCCGMEDVKFVVGMLLFVLSMPGSFQSNELVGNKNKTKKKLGQMVAWR